MLLLSAALELVRKINIMNTLVIDATGKKILLVLIAKKTIYTSTKENSKNNFDKITIFIDNFLKKNKTSVNKLDKIFVNRGPGSFSGIRNSISVVKGIHLSTNIDYFCYSYKDFGDEKYKKLNDWSKLPNLCKKYKIKKNLINPLYLS